MTPSWLYIATLRDRHGEQDVHLEFLCPGVTDQQRRGWCDAVFTGIALGLGRSGHLIELVVSADRAPVLGVGCDVESAVRESVAYLRKLEEGAA